MTATLASQITSIAGQPASVRVGTVESVNPPVVRVQGAAFTDVGFLNSYIPTVGDAVILLGQSSSSGSDPASWVCLGAATPNGVRSRQAVLDTNTTLAVAETLLSGTLVNFTTTAALTTVQAMWTGDFDVLAAVISTGVLRPSLDGVLQTQIQAIVEMPVAAIAGRWTCGNQALYTVGPGTHTIQLSASANLAGNLRLLSGSTNLLVNILG